MRGVAVALLPSVLMHGFQAAQMVASYASTPAMRVVALGRLAVSCARQNTPQGFHRDGAIPGRCGRS